MATRVQACVRARLARRRVARVRAACCAARCAIRAWIIASEQHEKVLER